MSEPDAFVASEPNAFVAGDWIPMMVTVALGAASLAVVFMAALAGIVGLFGFREIKKQAVAAATFAANDVLKRHVRSEEFKELVQAEASSVSVKAFVSRLQLHLDGKEDGNDQNEG